MPRQLPSRRLRAPWRRGAWSSAEIALALHAQRAELLRTLRTRGDARGLAETVLEEVVGDAICVVVMMRRPVVSEEHLIGAFWTAARILLRQHHEGRHSLRVGSRSRVGLDTAAVLVTSAELGPEEVATLKDRAARAADFVAQLSDLEREVVSAMATRGVGVKMTARLLGLPVKTVKAAQRSAQGKLDRVAVIAAAGRMCDYREHAITAYAAGSADVEEERIARVHLAACAPCRSSYVKLAREMRGRAFQRDAAAVFLPAPLIPFGHPFGLLGRLLGWSTDRPVRLGGERVAEALGGAGVVKVAAAGSAIVAATATIATSIHPPVRHHSPHHRHALIAARHPPAHAAVSTPVAVASDATQTPVTSTRHAQAPSHLTSREHAELEFSSLRSPRSSTPARSPERTASAATMRPSPSSAEVRANESPTESQPPAQNGPSAAAREFGQP